MEFVEDSLNHHFSWFFYADKLSSRWENHVNHIWTQFTLAIWFFLHSVQAAESINHEVFPGENFFLRLEIIFSVIFRFTIIWLNTFWYLLSLTWFTRNILTFDIIFIAFALFFHSQITIELNDIDIADVSGNR